MILRFTSSKKHLLVIMLTTLVIAVTGLVGCDSTHNNSSSKAQLQVKLHDAPALYGAVQLDIQKVEVKDSSNTSGWVTISNTPMTVNLLDLTNGNAKIIASSNVASGTYTLLRLVLGSSNKIKVNGTMMDLQLTGNAQSGVDVDIDTHVDAQNSATLLLDFDAARSIKSGLTGMFTLNPVITATQQSQSGEISGQVQPASAKAVIYARSGSDTLSTTYADSTSGNFKLIGVEEGSYDLAIHSMDTAYRDTTISNVSVSAKQETKVGVVTMPHN